MSENIRFSVIIPIYKVEKYLYECIDSVINQTFRNIEIVLVDDGSPDGCPQICDAYAQKDNRITVIHKKNGGLSSARNVGLQAAKGDYVIFLDSDDYYCRNDFLEIIDRKLGEKEVEALFFQRKRLVDATEEFLPLPTPYNLSAEDASSILYELAKKDKLEASAAMKVMKRTYLIEHALYFKEGIFSEDVEWFFRFAQNLQDIAVTDTVAYCYRLREGSITHTITEKNINDLLYSVTTYSESILQIEDETKKRALLNYLAYQYFIILSLSYRFLRGDSKKAIFKNLKKYKWLSKYALSGKTKKAAFAVNLCGLKIGAFLMSVYYSRKESK